MHPTIRRTLIVALLLLGLAGCKGLGREINQALPEFLRSEPGAEEMAIFRQVRQTRDWTPEDLANQATVAAEVKQLRAEGRFGDAANRLEEYLEDYPESRWDEAARFLLGDCNFHDDEWPAATKDWREFTTLYPVSDHNVAVIENLYHIGDEYLSGRRSAFFGIFSRRSVGERTLTQLIETFPTSERAADAQWLLARYHMEEEDWLRAEMAFGFITEQYTESEWHAPALYYRAYARYRLVKGVVYDPLTMAEAREAFEIYLARVPDGPWRADAREIAVELAELEAQHMLSVGEWYMGQDQPYGARYYLVNVMTRFPGSEAAGRARELLPEVGGAEDDAPAEVAPEVPAEPEPAKGTGS